MQPQACLFTDVSKNFLLLLYCESRDRGLPLRAQGHQTHQHKRSLSRSLCESLSSLHPPIAAAVARSYSFTRQAMSRQLLECPDLKCAEIATIASLTTKYQASQSGLGSSSIYQREESVED